MHIHMHCPSTHTRTNRHRKTLTSDAIYQAGSISSKWSHRQLIRWPWGQAAEWRDDEVIVKLPSAAIQYMDTHSHTPNVP